MSKMSLINELALLENIDIKSEKNNHDFFHNSKNLESIKLFNKLDFHLISRNVLKNKFFTNFLFKSYYNNSNHFKTSKELKTRKLLYDKKVKINRPVTLKLLDDNNINYQNKKKIKKNILSLDIINCRDNKIKTKPIKKFSHEEFRRKKYVKHFPMFGLNYKKEEENYNDSMIISKYLDTFSYSHNKNNTLKEIIPNYFLNFGSNSKFGDTLYKKIPIKCHNLSSRVESKKIFFHNDSKDNNVPKILRKKNIIDIIRSKNKPLFFISTNMNNKTIYKNLKPLNICEKKRYEKNMEIFLNLKKQIEENPRDKFEIAKNFLINNGFNESKYLSFQKLNILILFINENLELDASKTLKQNILNILKCEKNN